MTNPLTNPTKKQDQLKAEVTNVAFAAPDSAGILKGEAFRILPIGKFFRQSFFESKPRVIRIYPDDIRDIVKHFNDGMPRFRVPLNLDHNHFNGKVGTITKLEARKDGLYGYAELTEEGRKAVESGSHDAVSAEMAWDKGGYDFSYLDPQTGQSFSPVLVGCALTPTPFFGHNKTALYSVEPPDLEGFDDTTELEDEQQETEAMTTETTNKTQATSSVTQEAFDALLAKVEEMNAKLVAAEAATEEETATEDASDDATNDADSIAANERLSALEARNEELAAQNKRLADEMAETKKQARLKELALTADGFAHVPVERDEYAANIYALEQFDPKIAKWFTDKFAQLEVMAATGNLFEQVSHSNAETKIDTFADLVEKVLTEKFDGKRENYKEAVKEATRLNPQLAAEYQGAAVRRASAR